MGKKKRQSQKCLAEPQAISHSLQRIALHRPDLFINEEEEEQEERLRRLQEQREELRKESKKKKKKTAAKAGSTTRRSRSRSPGGFARPRSRSPQ